MKIEIIERDQLLKNLDQVNFHMREVLRGNLVFFFGGAFGWGTSLEMQFESSIVL